MPASAIMPIMAVAVKKTGLLKPPTGRLTMRLSSQKPGRMPMSVSRDRQHDDHRQDVRRRLIDQQDVDRHEGRREGDAQVLKTSSVIFHSPSPAPVNGQSGGQRVAFQSGTGD